MRGLETLAGRNKDLPRVTTGMMVAGLGNDRNRQRGDGLKINKITASQPLVVTFLLTSSSQL
jgi:hypothetical protein